MEIGGKMTCRCLTPLKLSTNVFALLIILIVIRTCFVLEDWLLHITVIQLQRVEICTSSVAICALFSSFCHFLFSTDIFLRIGFFPFKNVFLSFSLLLMYQSITKGPIPPPPSWHLTFQWKVFVKRPAMLVGYTFKCTTGQGFTEGQISHPFRICKIKL